ncbi:MAG: FKBP-type peptidyl-prolyl cis-trans isomerase [Elusimicrobia bacterium]|nr:FKBP-type peptidyl-prolyl cis-trans isomerase [Elusimicrobiota bacterium]
MKAALRLLAATAFAAAACAPARPPATSATEYSQKPAGAFEEAFVAQPGVRPIRFGGWLRTIEEGSGASPSSDSVVRVHYRGTLTDGTEFDSSVRRGEPATFSLRNVIRCWTFGVPMMKTGEKARFLCPGKTAYGAAGAPPVIGPNAALVFDIELLEIVR